jgi:chemotaxis protein MotC
MLLLGVYNYLRGRPQDARAALATMDPMAETPELGAFVALVRGTVEADGDAKAAMGLLDSARLLAPGSLIEEAALRRAAPLAVALGDRAGFLHLSEDYARRFLFSPYASQWADSFVNGVMALRDGLELSALDGVATVLDTERRQVLFLRIARRAAIEHDQALADFATSRAEGGATKGGDAQARLYAALPAITSEKGAEALKSLESIDPMGLSESDRELLATAKALAAELSAPPPVATVEAAPSPTPAETDAPVQAEPASVVEPAVAHADQAAPLAVPASGERPEPLAETAEAAGTGPAPAPSPDQAAETAASAQLNEARKTLADIDRLLEATN